MTITECNQDSDGNCTLESTASQIAYGSTDDTYMDPDGIHRGYKYKTGCGADCDSHNYKSSTAEGCGVLQEKLWCTSAPDNFLGIATCCSEAPVTSDGGVSSYNCQTDDTDGAWFPWSKNCVESPDGLDAIQKFCEGIDYNNCSVGDDDDPDDVCKARLQTIDNCKLWCAQNPDMCDSAKTNFCATYPDNKHCACINRDQDQEYVDMLQYIDDGGCPNCWYEPCSVDTTNLIPENLRASNCPCPTSICTAVISVIDAGEVDISNIDQTISCNNTPPPDPTDGGGGISTLEWGLIIGGSVVLVTIVIVVSVLLSKKK